MKFDRFSVRGLLIVCMAIAALGAFTGCGSDDNDTAGGSTAEANAQTDPGSTTSTNVAKGSTGSTDIKPQDPEDKNKDSNGISTEPPPVQILTGDTTGIEVDVPTVIVAQNKAQRTAMLKRHYTNGVEGDPKTVTGTTFTDRQLVGLFLPKSPKGTVVVVTDVHEEDGRIVVSAVKLLNGEGCKTSGKRPRPFHIVETRKMELNGKPVVKIKAQRASPC